MTTTLRALITNLHVHHMYTVDAATIRVPYSELTKCNELLALVILAHRAAAIFNIDHYCVVCTKNYIDHTLATTHICYSIQYSHTGLNRQCTPKRAQSEVTHSHSVRTMSAAYRLSVKPHDVKARSLIQCNANTLICLL
jgi:hypothetical protein